MQRIVKHSLGFNGPNVITVPLGSKVLYFDLIEPWIAAVFILEGTNDEIERENRTFYIYEDGEDVSYGRYDKIFLGAVKADQDYCDPIKWFFLFEEKKK